MDSLTSFPWHHDKEQAQRGGAADSSWSSDREEAKQGGWTRRFKCDGCDSLGPGQCGFATRVRPGDDTTTGGRISQGTTQQPGVELAVGEAPTTSSLKIKDQVNTNEDQVKTNESQPVE